MQPLQSHSPGWIRAGVYRNGRVNTMFTNASYKSRTAPSLGKEGCTSPTITLLDNRAAERWHWPRTKKKQRVKHDRSERNLFSSAQWGDSWGAHKHHWRHTPCPVAPSGHTRRPHVGSKRQRGWHEASDNSALQSFTESEKRSMPLRTVLQLKGEPAIGQKNKSITRVASFCLVPTDSLKEFPHSLWWVGR